MYTALYTDNQSVQTIDIEWEMRNISFSIYSATFCLLSHLDEYMLRVEVGDLLIYCTYPRVKLEPLSHIVILYTNFRSS